MIDKIFKAYDVRATYPNPLNEEAAWKVGHASAQFLKRSRQNVAADQKVKMEDTMCVGRDMRPHSPNLAAALIENLMIERMTENDKIVTRYMENRDFQGSAFPILAREIFETIRGRTPPSPA